MSNEAKPPDRWLIDWKKMLPTVSAVLALPRVLGLVHSNRARKVAEMTASDMIVTSVSLVCKVHRRGWRHSRKMFRYTGKPSAPTKTPRPIGMSIHGSAEYGYSPRGSGENPALLNEEIA